MMDGMDFVDDVDTEETHLRGYVHCVHNVHSVHYLNNTTKHTFNLGTRHAVDPPARISAENQGARRY